LDTPHPFFQKQLYHWRNFFEEVFSPLSVSVIPFVTVSSAMSSDEKPRRARGPGTEADLTSVVAMLEAHFAQSLMTQKPRRRASGSEDQASNSKSAEFETLNALETALYRSPKDALLSLQPQIEKLLLKKCLPLSGRHIVIFVLSSHFIQLLSLLENLLLNVSLVCFTMETGQL
jgi:hypothetical protein